jgi:hypothetical protein
MKRKDVVECSCGKKFEVEEKQTEVCPDCGAMVWQDTGYTGLSAADTQTVNIRDMARMAQDGVDVSVSGEWDTSGRKEDDK